MQKPDKIYIHNPNVLCAFAKKENIGTLRECFFVNQMMVTHEVEYGKKLGDFPSVRNSLSGSQASHIDHRRPPTL